MFFASLFEILLIFQKKVSLRSDRLAKTFSSHVSYMYFMLKNIAVWIMNFLEKTQAFYCFGEMFDAAIKTVALNA